jgi:hypothetical protein
MSPAVRPVVAVALLLLFSAPAPAETCNLKILTDASPDYTDLPSLIHSATSRWETPQQKCWAMFYWNHVARRQTNPIILHGMACTDPIRQFNDYGYTMCSTISGINQSIWEQMGLKHHYWDITNHTVAEVFYDGRWHMYDNSMSALYTLCDGVTLAGVEDIGKPGACALSGGKVEPGHIAKYHCLTATSPNGFLCGADTARALDEEYQCFNPNTLKLRTYYYDWDRGHRYILNLSPGESYMRHYASLGTTPEFYVPNDNGEDPESANPHFHLRGNGRWEFDADLTRAGFAAGAYSASHVVPVAPAGLHPDNPDTASEVIFKVSSANVTTSQVIHAEFQRREADECSISVGTTNGLHWKEVWKADGNATSANVPLIAEVNGSYETLIKVRMLTHSDPASLLLKSLHIQTTTQLNAKTQPKLNIGRNTIYIGAGEQTESIVLWPNLEHDHYKDLIVEEHNVASLKKHNGYQGVLYCAKPKQDAWIVYRLDAPADITRLTFGGRFYNRADNSHIDLLYSLDDGVTWTIAWTLTDTEQPWDVIHYETLPIPAGHKSVKVKYLMNTTTADKQASCSIYAVRMEANYAPPDTSFHPMDVTFTWAERQADWSLIERSHTQRVEKLPFTYAIDVGGEDRPVVKSLAIASATGPAAKSGYSGGKTIPNAQKWTGRWLTLGRNLAVGKPYTVSHPSLTDWGAGDPDGKKLTDGVAGPTYAGGPSFQFGLVWAQNTNPTLTVDLGQSQPCASFGLNLHGYPWHDALKGQLQDQVEVLTSEDGQTYTSRGHLNTNIRLKDIPVNFMLPDDETLCGDTFRFIPEKPITSRYVKYKVTSPRIFCATEIEVLDSITLEPFDLRIALPR